MTRFSRLNSLMLIVVAFAIGFGLERTVFDLPDEKDATVEPLASTGKVSRQVPDRPNGMDSSLSVKFEEPVWATLSLPEMERAFRMTDDPAAFARGFLMWLRVVETSDIAQRSKEGESVSNPLVTTSAVARWAQLQSDAAIAWSLEQAHLDYPVRTSERSDSTPITEQLKSDSELILNRLDDSESHQRLREFCTMFLAARHPEFDLAWAVENDVSVHGFANIWLKRGMSPSDVVDAAIQAEFLDIKGRGIVIDAALTSFYDRDERWADMAAELIARARKAGIEPVGTFMLALESEGDVARPLEVLRFLDLIEMEHRAPRKLISLALDQDSGATISWLLSELEPEQRRPLIREAFRRPGNDNAVAPLLELYRALPVDGRPRSLKNLNACIPADAGFTLEWCTFARNLDAPPEGLGWITQNAFARLLANEGGRQEAAALIDNFPPGELRHQLILRLAANASQRSDSDMEEKWLSQLPAAVRSNFKTAQLLKRLKNEDIDSALNLIRSEMDSPKRQQEMARDYAKYVPADQRVALLKAFDLEPTEGELQTIAIEWAQADPRKTVAWLGGLDPDQSGYETAVDLAVHYWAKQDIDAAAEYVQTLPPGAARDRSAINLIRTGNRLDPHTALEWSATLSDPELRREHLTKSLIAIDIFATRPEEAVEAIQELSASEEDKLALLEALKL